MNATLIKMGNILLSLTNLVLFRMCEKFVRRRLWPRYFGMTAKAMGSS